ncbi:MAG TPA: hypothetical protein PKA37_15175, partial [Planctomycetota bacterium]|nr:hypothetical protein [Planctomycetota bacterium]
MTLATVETPLRNKCPQAQPCSSLARYGTDVQSLDSHRGVRRSQGRALKPMRGVTLVALLTSLFVAGAGAQATVAWQVPTRGVSVASDPSNAVFTIDYEQTLGLEITLTKRDVNGNLLWVSSFDQTDPTKWERAEWVASDSEGNALVAGTLMSGFSNPVVAASILMKFAPDGTFLWRQVFESAFDGSHTRRCLVDPSDNIYVFGTGQGPLGLVSKVKKFSPGGAPIWSYFDTDGIGAPLHAKWTPQGNLLLIGRGIQGSINGYAMIDTNGNRLFGIGGITSTTLGDAATDSLGQTYLVNAQAVLSGGTVLRKLDANGATLWQQNFAMSAFRVEVGPDDNPIIAGFPNQGTPGAAFMKLGQNGQVIWSNMDADGPQALLLHAHMLVDSSGDAYLAASTLFQMAVCKVRADGTSASTVLLPGSGAQAIAFSNDDGGVYVVGGYTARILDPEEGPWTDLGGGLSGTGALTPHLFGTGNLTPGSVGAFHLGFARPNTPTIMVIGLQ